MIKTTIIALIEGRRYEFTAELAEVAGWADTPNETAIGMLHDSMDQLSKAIEWDAVPDPAARTGVNYFVQADAIPDPVTDENGNRQCYLCGFYHDEPGSCANGAPTNLTPGPDDEPEYDGPTMDDDDHWFWSQREELDENEKEDLGYHGPEEGDYRESAFPTLDEILETGRPYLDDDDGSGVPSNVRYAAIAKAVVEASKRDEGDQ